MCKFNLFYAEALVEHEFFFGEHTFPYFVNKTNCNGSEEHLIDCPGTDDMVGCKKIKAAKVYCTGTINRGGIFIAL